MAFTIDDLQDLLQLLRAHPEWRAELRRELLTDELLDLPQAVRALADEVRALVVAQQRTEEQVNALAMQVRDLAAAQRRTEEQVRALVVAQQRTEEQVNALAMQVRDLATAQQRTEEQVRDLATAQRRTEEQVRDLATAQRRTEEQVRDLAMQVRDLTAAQQRTEEQVRALVVAQLRTEERLERLEAVQERMEERLGRLEVDVGVLKGNDAERRYQERAPAYFRPIVMRAHALTADERSALVEEAMGQGLLSDHEATDVLLADVLVRGRRRDDQREVYLVVEVSWGIGLDDVARAARRATLLGRAGLEVVPVVAGDSVTPEAAEQARLTRVWQITDGRAVPPEGA